MRAEYKRVLELLPTANSEEIKMLAKVLYHIIDSLEGIIEIKDERIKSLEDFENNRIESLERIIKTKDETIKINDKRIANLEDWLKDKDKEIEILELQLRTNEFDRLFVFGKGNIGKA
jgi:predicted RNase H-like nuclease (RuvC/YqgF family)